MNFFDSLEPHEIAQNIKEIVHCPFCGSDYQEKYIKILGKMEGNYIIQLFCVECRNNIMANFSYKNNRGIIKQDNKMDVKMGEMIRFAEKGAVSDDDIMDFYKATKKFDGDFEKLFKKLKN